MEGKGHKKDGSRATDTHLVKDLWLAAPAPLKSSWLTLLASTPLLFGQSPLRKEF